MKLILSFFLILLANVLFAQGTYTIVADSVKMTGIDSAELVIRNHTQNVPGFLYNNGHGATIFKRPLTKINDTFYLVGADTLKMRYPAAWVEGGNSYGTGGKFGTLDKTNIDFFANKQPVLRLDTAGSLLVGGLTANAGFKLDVTGQARVIGFVDITNGVIPDITINPGHANGFGTSITSTEISFGGARFAMNESAVGIIPVNSLIIGNASPGSLTTLVDYYKNPVFVVDGSGRSSINGGYNGISNAGATGSTQNANANTFYVNGSRGTGGGAVGDIVFSTDNTQPSGATIHTMTNRWWLKGGTGYLSNASSPTSSLDVTGANGYSQLRMRTTYTPSSSSDTNGNVGDFSWDSSYLYVRTSTGWKRLAITTF